MIEPAFDTASAWGTPTGPSCTRIAGTPSCETECTAFSWEGRRGRLCGAVRGDARERRWVCRARAGFGGPDALVPGGDGETPESLAGPHVRLRAMTRGTSLRTTGVDWERATTFWSARLRVAAFAGHMSLMRPLDCAMLSEGRGARAIRRIGSCRGSSARIGLRVLVLSGMLWLCSAAFSPVAWARTVVLVYDDSGSMETESRFAFASYATQNLLALLSPDDRLEVVRMSAPDRWTTLLPERSQQDGIGTIAQWAFGGSTPYLSVQTAAARLRELGRANVDPDEDFWLVVFSDGEFWESGGAIPQDVVRQRVALDLADLRDDFEGRRLGVLFLGIGPEADTYADVWRAAGAITETAVSSREIIGAMFRIAALVTGRDPQADAAATALRATPGRARGTVEVATALPLQRLVVFYQGTRASGLRIVPDGSTVRSGPSAASVAVRGTEPLRTEDGGVHGAVIGVVGARFGEVMGPGTFTLALDSVADISLADLRFLPEVALALEVERLGGAARTCAGETVTLHARLTDTMTRASVDLRDLTGLEIVAQVEGDTERRSTPFRVLDANTYGVDLVVPAGRSTVSVTARYPGYFNFRSQLFAFDGEACAAGFSATLAEATLAVPATFRPELHAAAETALMVTPSRAVPVSEVAFDVTALGVPDGVAIEMEGVRVDDRPVRLALPLGRPVPLRVLTSADFDVPSGDLTLRVEPVDGAIVATGVTTVLELVLDPVQVRLVPRSLGPFDLEPSMSTAFVFAAGADFELSADPPFDADPGVLAARVTASSVPAGVEVRVEGTPLGGDEATDTASLQPAGPNRLEVWVREGLTIDAVQPLTLRFEGTDARVAWQAATLDLAFASRARVLALQAEGAWATDFHELAESPAFVVTPTVGGRAATADELAGWAVDVSVPGRLGVEAQVDPGEQRLLVRIKPARWPLFTRTGRVDVEVRASTPFGEEVVERFPLDIADVPFLERWGLPILFLVLASFVIWIAVAYVRKPKFARGAGFRVFDVIQPTPGALGVQGDELQRRSREVVLFARSSVGLSRVWPFGPQRAAVGPFRVRAGERRGEVYLDPIEAASGLDGGTSQVWLRGQELDRRRPRRLKVDDVLSVDVEGSVSHGAGAVVRREYRYEKGLRHI
jgi:hypothetical protein